MFRKFESLIDVFRAHDESQPPAALIGYYWRFCRQTWPFLVALMASGLFTSLIEVSILRFVGEIVDLLRQTTPERLLADDGRLFLFMGFVDPGPADRWRSSRTICSRSRRSRLA